MLFLGRVNLAVHLLSSYLFIEICLTDSLLTAEEVSFERRHGRTDFIIHFLLLTTCAWLTYFEPVTTCVATPFLSQHLGHILLHLFQRLVFFLGRLESAGSEGVCIVLVLINALHHGLQLFVGSYQLVYSGCFQRYPLSPYRLQSDGLNTFFHLIYVVLICT